MSRMEEEMAAREIPKSVSRKVNGYVKAVLRLEEVRLKREERYDRYVRPLDRRRDVLVAEVDRRMRALSGTQQAEARRILGDIAFACSIPTRQLVETEGGGIWAVR